MSDFDCSSYIIDIKNDMTINQRLKANLLDFYLKAYKFAMKKELCIG